MMWAYRHSCGGPAFYYDQDEQPRARETVDASRIWCLNGYRPEPDMQAHQVLCGSCGRLMNESFHEDRFEPVSDLVWAVQLARARRATT